MQQRRHEGIDPVQVPVNTMTYGERVRWSSNPTAKILFSIMEEKKTNLAVAADVKTKKELLALADQIGPFICLFKTHIDIIEDFDADLTVQLEALAKKHNFLLFEDRKFADIGNTVKDQYEGGIYKIAQWAHIVNAHALIGPSIIEALKIGGIKNGRGLLLLAQMSNAGSLITESYTRKAVEHAQQHRDFVIGFIAMERIVDDPSFIIMTPGVQINASNDALGQQYVSPESAMQKGTDVIIVGRGIYKATDPAVQAQFYRDVAWKAYMERIS